MLNEREGCNMTTEQENQVVSAESIHGDTWDFALNRAWEEWDNSFHLFRPKWLRDWLEQIFLPTWLNRLLGLRPSDSKILYHYHSAVGSQTSLLLTEIKTYKDQLERLGVKPDDWRDNIGKFRTPYKPLANPPAWMRKGRGDISPLKEFWYGSVIEAAFAEEFKQHQKELKKKQKLQKQNSPSSSP
jgi:hypothetical protein